MVKIGLKMANFLQNSDQIRVWHGENVFLARRARAVPCRPARRTDARQAATLMCSLNHFLFYHHAGGFNRYYCIHVHTCLSFFKSNFEADLSLNKQKLRFFEVYSSGWEILTMT